MEYSIDIFSNSEIGGGVYEGRQWTKFKINIHGKNI